MAYVPSSNYCTRVQGPGGRLAISSTLGHWLVANTDCALRGCKVYRPHAPAYGSRIIVRVQERGVQAQWQWAACGAPVP